MLMLLTQVLWTVVRCLEFIFEFRDDSLSTVGLLVFRIPMIIFIWAHGRQNFVVACLKV